MSALRIFGIMATVVATMSAAPQIQNLINMTASSALSDTAKATILRVGGTPVAEAVIDLISQSCIFAEDNLFLRRLAFLETNDGYDPSTYANKTSDIYRGIWKVTEQMFLATRANTIQLQTKYAAIRDAFGIDWTTVKWDDLQRPLYSGLAAALYLYTVGAVPIAPEQQGTYVQNNFDRSISAFNYTLQGQNVPVCQQEPKIDVAFLLDSRTSVNDFARMRKFVHDVIAGPVRNATSDNLRAAVYQFGGGQPSVVKTMDLQLINQTDKDLLLFHILASTQAKVQWSPVDLGEVVKTVVHDLTQRSTRPLSAKMIILFTDQSSANPANLAVAAQDAVRSGVSVMALGVGPNTTELDQLVTKPTCRHHLRVSSFQDLSYYVQLVQRTICSEPMIGRGMIHCQIEECRNLAFPITNAITTLIANVTCSDGHLYVTTRTPRPSLGYDDFSQYMTSDEGPVYVTIDDRVREFIYADFVGTDNTDPACFATLSTVNGIVGPLANDTCDEWAYPVANPCQTPGRSKDRFPYYPDQNKFIVCDQQDKMYLTKCPPEDPIYDHACDVCGGGPNSLPTGNCLVPVLPTQTPLWNYTEFCGRNSNPCTRENILQNSLYFDCPMGERYFLQCNLWGHAFIRECPENEVWRQSPQTCEYIGSPDYNPCGTPGVRYYPYPHDPHLFVDCGADMIPYLKHCQLDLVWNPAVDVCDYPPQTTLPAGFSHAIQSVTLPAIVPGAGPTRPSLYSAPCTKENIAALELYFPYPGHSQQYIQCDLWGDRFIMDCQPGFFYNEFSHTCVDGPVIVG